MWTWFYKLASPPYVYGVAAALMPWFLGLAAITIGYGLIGGLVFATVATLFFVPVIFSLFHRRQQSAPEAAAEPENNLE